MGNLLEHSEELVRWWRSRKVCPYCLEPVSWHVAVGANSVVQECMFWHLVVAIEQTKTGVEH